MAVIEIEVRGQDRGAGTAIDHTRTAVRQVERSLDQAGQAGREATQEIRRGAGQAGGALDDAADSAGDLASATEDAGDSGGFLSEKLSELTGRAGKFGEMLGKLGPIGTAAAAVVGAAVIGVGAAIKGAMEAANASMERTNALARSKAQLGLSEADAAKFGKIAGKIYADNFGETLEDAGKAARDTAMFITNMTDPAFTALAEKLSAVSDMMEADTKETARAIAQLMRTGMVKSADEAFDLIVAATNKGIDASDDLLDTIGEYSVQFKKVGIDGKTAFGLIHQMLQAGARDADIAADAIKEFSIRSIDGSAGAAASYKALGLDAKKMIKAFAEGGPAADKAFADVINRLKAIKDPAERSAAAVGLFGTQAEDLGSALFAMDLEGAKADFADIAGAADKATATMGGSAFNTIESYRRQWEMFKADVGDKLIPTFERVLDMLERVGKALKPIASNGIEEIAKAWDDNSKSIEEFWSLAEPILKLLGGAAIGAIVLAIGQVIVAISFMGNQWSMIKGVFAAVTPFILDMLYAILSAAAAAFGWIPGLGPKLDKAKADFAKFRDETNAMLAGIKDKNVVVTIERKVLGPALGPEYGFRGHARGTDNAPPGYAVVGEEGPELVKFRGGEQVSTTADSAAMMAAWNGGGGRGYGGGSSGMSVRIEVAKGPAASAHPAADMVIEALRSRALVLKVSGSRVVAA